MKYLVTNPDSFGDIVLRQPLLTGLLDAGHEVGVLVKRSYSQIIHFVDPRLRIFPIDDVNPYIVSILDQKDKIDETLDEVEEFDLDVLVIAPYHRTLIDNWTFDRFAHKKTFGMQGFEFDYENGIRVLRPVTRNVKNVLHVPENLSEVEKNRRMLALCLGKEVTSYPPQLKLPASTIQLARETLKQLQLKEESYVIATPGSTSLELKQYPVDRFVRIFSHWWTTYKRPILLVGNKIEEAVVEEIHRSLKQLHVQSTIWTGDESHLEVLLGLTALSKVYFGNDTGPMHFAAALEKPVLAIFGGGTWPRFIPAAKEGAAVLQELPCFGCGWQCMFEKALCIHDIEERRVIEAVDQFEKGKLKSFKVLDEPFEGETVTSWIAEAKEKMKDYKHRFEVDRVAREKESTEFHQHRASLRDELDTLHTQLSEAHSQHQQMHEQHTSLQQAMATKSHEWQIVQLQLQYQTENASLVKSMLETEKRENSKIAEQLKAVEQKFVGVQKQFDDERGRAKALDEKVRLLQTQLTQQTDELKKEREHHLNLKTVARGMEDQIRTLQRQEKQHQEQFQSLTRQLDTERKIKYEALRQVHESINDIKPKLEELHLAIRYQDETLRHMEEGLIGVIHSGWVKLGLRLGVPWLTRWHNMIFTKSSANGSVQVKKQDFENPLSVKDHLMKKINDLVATLDKVRTI